VEHANFEFTLGLEIRRDEHIVRQLHANISRPLVPPSRIKEADAASTTSHMRNGGFRHLFSSPRKGSKTPKAVMAEVAQPVQKPQEINIGHYFPPGQSMIAKTHIAFKPIAKNCDSRLLEIRYPMFGHVRQSDAVQPGLVAKGDRPSSQPPAGTNASEPAPIRKQVCKITLQIFRLPPLPGLEPDQLPQSIDECLRGMRHHAWHGHEYHEGVLTQKGGDSNVSMIPAAVLPRYLSRFPTGTSSTRVQGHWRQPCGP
jgi:serine/arginine repetitive matrix protein 2